MIPRHTPTIIQPSTSQPEKKQRPRKPKRKDTQIPQFSGPTDNVADEGVNEDMNDSLERASTTATSLDAEYQETMGDTIDQTRVLDLETTKTTQANEIASLKRRVKKLERGIGEEDASKKGRRINAIDADEDITLVNDQDDADMFDVNTLIGAEVLAEPKVVVKDVNLSIDEVTLAQALAALKSAKVQEKGDVVEETSVPVSAASTKISAATTTTTATIPTPRKGIEKGKRKMVEPEKPMKKKELIRLDEEIASKLQAEFDKEPKIEADHELAQRLQAQEQEELSDAEKATLFVQLLEKRRKHFATKRAEEKNNKPPTQAQQRKIMCTYLKNMEGKKPK
ncbi:hypothetical protein Tco_1536785, partial [Tanacetum coccineum]